MMMNIRTKINNQFSRYYQRLFFGLANKRHLKSSDLPLSLLKSYCSRRTATMNKSLCNAPFNSIYLGVNGFATPCCYNREMKFGEYRCQSVHELWNSDAYRRFREVLRNYTFPDSCAQCKNHFLKRNFLAMGAESYNYIPVNPKQPSEIVFELSDQCNYRCVMCKGSEYNWLERHASGIPKDEHFSFLLDQLTDIIPNLYSAKFLGGEPFYIEQYFTIWEKIISINPECLIDVQTNGSIVNERVKKILDKGKFSIGVSMDSLDDEIYKTIRSGGTLKNVLENITFFSQYTKRAGTNLYFATCPMPLNWKEIPDIVKFCNSYNAPLFFNTVMVPSQLSLFSFSSQKLESVISFLEMAKLPSGNHIMRHNKNCYLEFLGELKLWMKQNLLFEPMSKENINMLEHTDISGLFAELKEKHYKCVPSKNNTPDAENNWDFGSFADDMSKSLPNDIYFKMMLKYFITMPDDKYYYFIINNSYSELLRRAGNIYLKIKDKNFTT